MTVKILIKKNGNHDISISITGHVHVWDDNTCADNINYDNKKLNELEKNRKENVDRIKMVAQQTQSSILLHSNDNIKKI